MSAISPGYEGTDYCEGMTVAFEVKMIAMDLAGILIKIISTRAPLLTSPSDHPL
jgi:hypothetical protein